MGRLAIVSSDKCKPKECGHECKRNCPVVAQGKQCIEVVGKVASISESLCIGCGICVKKCPFNAIAIINLPDELQKEITHRYGTNTFKLHRLPIPRPGQILGLVGANGMGKSTALNILSGKLKPNLGLVESPPDWKEILAHFRGCELQLYMQKLQANSMKAIIKPQYVDMIPRLINGKVGEILEKKDDRGMKAEYSERLELTHLYSHDIKDLSGGELQRFAISVVCVQKAQVIMFDELSTYLDVRQRMVAAEVIRDLRSDYIIVVEHDLAVLDYLSDFVCCLWGVAGAYGVVTMPYTTREGVNIFLDGYVPTENLRFRKNPLVFNAREEVDDSYERSFSVEYPEMKKSLGSSFVLQVEKGSFSNSEVIVLLGQNGSGKTTFLRMLAGLLEPDNGFTIPALNVSYKPQTFARKFGGTVHELLLMKIRDAYFDPQFQSDVMKPMLIANIEAQLVQTLSGGEVQRVALVLALGKSADMYLIDEPSAFLDIEQRVVASQVIKRFVLHTKKTAFIVEHDFMMSTYLADRVILFDGKPGGYGTASSPTSLLEGMNKFLSQLKVTFRRDPTNFRPRINKLNSIKDREQKMSGKYFTIDD